MHEGRYYQPSDNDGNNNVLFHVIYICVPLPTKFKRDSNYGTYEL